jgi:hypothetical protein
MTSFVPGALPTSQKLFASQTGPSMPHLQEASFFDFPSVDPQNWLLASHLFAPASSLLHKWLAGQATNGPREVAFDAASSQ